jgi:hypothetical protein
MMAYGYGNPSPDQIQPQPLFAGNNLLGTAQGMFGGLRRGFQAGNRALHPYSNRLMLAGMGMLGGGPKEAMKGLVAGSALDTEDADRRKLNKALQDLMSSESDLIPDDPAIRGLMAADDKFAEATLLQRMKPTDYGEKYNGYLRAKAEGYPGDWMQYQEDTKTGPMVTVGGEEKSFDKTFGETLAKDYGSMQQGGRDATAGIGKLERLRQALSNPAVYQGTGGNAVNYLKGVGASLGFQVEGLTDAEVAQGLTRELALEIRNPSGGAGMPGALSDSDRKYLESIAASLGNRPETNAQKIDIAIKLKQREQDVARLAREYRKQNGGQFDDGFYDYLDQWSQANPLFANAPPLTPGGNSFTSGE